MQVHEDPDAAQLRAALRGGCEKAWTALYERYTPSLISYGLITVSHRPAYDMEAIVAAVWLSTWSRRQRFDENILMPFKFHAYLKLGVLNQIRDHYRRHSFRQEFSMASLQSALGLGNSVEDGDDFISIVDKIAGKITSAPDPADEYETLETRGEVREILRAMTDKKYGNELRALVLILVHGHGFTYHEATDALATTHASLKSRLFRARHAFEWLWVEKHGIQA